MNDDFADLLGDLLRESARFIVVGAHALAVHGVPRATGDLDVWVEPTPENARRVWDAIQAFGIPAHELGVFREDFEHPGTVIQVGLPPRRIDFLTRITGVEFAEAWSHRTVRTVRGMEVPFLGRDALLRNKRATGRTKDLADVEALESDGES